MHALLVRRAATSTTDLPSGKRRLRAWIVVRWGSRLRSLWPLRECTCSFWRGCRQSRYCSGPRYAWSRGRPDLHTSNVAADFHISLYFATHHLAPHLHLKGIYCVQRILKAAVLLCICIILGVLLQGNVVGQAFGFLNSQFAYSLRHSQFAYSLLFAYSLCNALL